MSGGWSTSDRRAHLPSNWRSTIRPAVLARDPDCTCTGCPRCTPDGCTRPSTDADHLGDRDDHRLEVLAGKCDPCHGHKSSQEGVTARRAQAARKFRPQKPHPGLL